MKQNLLETIIGFLVLLTAIVFLFFSYSSQKTDIEEQYNLTAIFESIDGIIEGSDVNIGGIVVGKVAKLKLDTKTYNAIATLAISKKIKIPTDSRASVSSSGFLGGKFIAIAPGGDDGFLEDNAQIKYTQSSINLESLIGKFMYSTPSSSSTNSSPASPLPQQNSNLPNNSKSGVQ